MVGACPLLQPKVRVGPERRFGKIDTILIKLYYLYKKAQRDTKS